MSELCLLHTAESHIPRFAATLHELSPETTAEHVVRADLLEEVRARGGVDDAVARKLGEVLDALPSRAVILCTCSTLGAAAEAFDGSGGRRVLRVDRPLMRAAVAQGSRVVVVAALSSTLEPTRRLLEEEATRAGKEVTLELIHVEEAWKHFEAGEQGKYLRLIAECADTAASRADVVVLAQASMAGAECYAQTEKSVLSSPVLGVRAALELLNRR